MLPCFNKTIFGVECPGCGSQRALYLLLEGKFLEAFKMYPPIFTLIIFFIVIFLHFLDKKRNYTKLIKIFAIINGILIVSFYLYKITNT